MTDPKRDGSGLNEDVRQRIANDYDPAAGGGQAISGILSGFTRKYSEDFTYRLIGYEWMGDQMQYRLHPDSGYIDELRDRLGVRE